MWMSVEGTAWTGNNSGEFVVGDLTVGVFSQSEPN